MSAQRQTDATFDSEYKRYVYGLIAALLLTYAAYFAVTNEWLSGYALAGWLLGLAAVQFILQLVVFLHVGQESKPRWTMWSIIYTMMMMLIIVVASLWIMANMNYNMMMSPDQMQEFMLEQNKKGF